jgi:DNA mismatch repair protein MutS2
LTHDSHRILEFDQVLEMLAARCEYSVARERAREIAPAADRDQVCYLLAVTREAVDLLTGHVEFSVRGVRDIRDAVSRAEKGALLAPSDLREILDTLQATRTLKRSLYRISQGEETYPKLGEFAEAIADLPELETDLARTVGPRAEILDSASPALGRIRGEIKVAHRRLLERLQRMVADSRYQPALQEPIVTMREGRYVIPVRADRRSQVPGVVQGSSASGQTLFVEPMDVVDLNNRWRELQMAEEHEIERVLRQRTDQVGDEAPAIHRSIEAVTAIDIALAKARLAFDLRATEPEIHGAGSIRSHSQPRHRIHLRDARHPLLDQREVVPIDLDLGERFRVLIVTGPNTGGKTVALKTVGLLTLMAQSGMFIPARDGSVVSIFSGVYADIGDEQSIEQSLSTFSSHMTKIVATLRTVDEDSLVLLDEIGAGTDPEEGSALARAIILALLEKGCLAVVTTHYSELKAFAYVTDGTENASVEFDVETLQPTYRLMIGVAGQSKALAIARRLGMPESVVAHAESLLEPESRVADEMLDEIRRRLSAAQSAESEAEEERNEIVRLRREAEEARREAEAAKTLARQEVLAELDEEIATARRLIRRLESMPRPQTPDAAAQLEPDPARELRGVEERVRRVRRRRPKPSPASDPIRIGDSVEVTSLGMEGEVLGFDDTGEQAEIQVGAFKVQQPVALLKRTGRARARQPARRAVSFPTGPPVSNEIHFRGKRAEEVARELDAYLDDAALASLPWVRIVHGKGTGALRTVVHDLLREHPAIDRFETAPVQEGGDGVTIAYFRS